MKNGALTTKLITVLIFLGVVIWFSVQTWNYFTRPENTSTVYTYRAERVLQLDGWLVRDEDVVDCTEPLVDLTRTEGERVARGKPLATVYLDAQALNAEKEVIELREQLEQLQFAQSAAKDTETALRLDTEIENNIITLRAQLESRNYTALDSSISAMKTIVLRREFAYHGSSDLTERIENLQAQLNSARRSVGNASRIIYAPFSGTYSTVTDGYENVLTPEALDTLTPADLDTLQQDAARSTVGKLIRGSRWYFAAAMAEADAAILVSGKTYELAISGVETSLPVRVRSVGRAQNGRCLAIFQSDEYLSAVTALRYQSAELILQSFTGLRVPKNALRIGEDGQTGVYCRIGRFATFKPVKLIYQGEDFCLVEPGDIVARRESDLILYTIRAGDEAIVTASELYNGKVIN